MKEKQREVRRAHCWEILSRNFVDTDIAVFDMSTISTTKHQLFDSHQLIDLKTMILQRVNAVITLQPKAHTDRKTVRMHHAPEWFQEQPGTPKLQDNKHLNYQNYLSLNARR